MASPSTSWPRALVIYACGVGAGLQFAKASVVFDPLVEHYAASETQVGWIVSSVGIVGMVLGATAGLVVAALGARPALLAALALAAVLSLAEATLPPLPVFLALRAIEGASHLTIVVAAPTCLGAVVAPRERALALGLWATFMSVAFLVAGAAAPGLAAHFGLGAVFLVHGLAMSALAVAAGFVAPSTPSRRRAEPFSLASAARDHIAIYRNARTATPALCFLAYTGMYLALQTLTPELAPKDERAFLIVGMAVVSICASLLAGALSHRGVSPFLLTVGAFATTAIASVALAFAVGHDEAIGAAALFRMAFLSLLPGAILQLIPMLNREPGAQAHAFGAVAQMGNVGSALGPPIFAASSLALGPVGLLLPALALCAAGGLFTAFAWRRFGADASGTA